MTDRSALLKNRLKPGDLPQMRKEVLTPTVIRRPMIDAMLAQSAIIAAKYLDELAQQAMAGVLSMEKRDVDKFSSVCELVLKQARVEMAIEKHVEERTGAMEVEGVAQGIVDELAPVFAEHNVSEALAEAIIRVILETLGLEHE